MRCQWQPILVSWSFLVLDVIDGKGKRIYYLYYVVLTGYVWYFAFFPQIEAEWGRDPAVWPHLHWPHVGSFITYILYDLWQIIKHLTSSSHCLCSRLTVSWREGRGWGQPRIGPHTNLSLSPASKVRGHGVMRVWCHAWLLQVFHYAQELYEGMKAYRGVDGKLRLFRPDLNMKRMNQTANRWHIKT